MTGWGVALTERFGSYDPEWDISIWHDLEVLQTARSINLLERLFGEDQRRAKVSPRFTCEKSGLSLMLAVLIAVSASWRGVNIAPAIQHTIG